jgi:uncharacterized membrane protein YqjE
MESFTDEAARLGGSTGRISRSLMAIGENRLKLLILEFEEERILFVRSLVLSLGVFAFGLLGMGALTTAVVIGPWTQSPGLVLGVFAGLYGLLAITMGLIVRRMMRRAEPFSATLDQLRKDRSSVEKLFS